jgi:ATP-binding cassette subfamily B protein
MKKKYPVFMQHDSMLCGVACLQMICEYYGKSFSQNFLERYCSSTNEGVSLLNISDAASTIGFHTSCGKATPEQLRGIQLPCIIHWNQNHFVVLYRIKKNKYYVADPGKGLLIYDEKDFLNNWLSTVSANDEKGVVLILQVTPKFYENENTSNAGKRSFSFLFQYIKQYKRYFGQIVIGLIVGSIIQLIFPFLTQAIVDIGIDYRNIHFIYLILLAQLMLILSRTSINFIRSWILLHISMRINISLVSDFFIKLLRLPMNFFDNKMIGDILQRINDHDRVEKFLTNQALSVIFSIITFVIFGIVLMKYNLTIFSIFLLGSLIYAIWITIFLRKRKMLDYQVFEKQSLNKSKTYQFISSIQEIKLQDCEQRKRFEWEDIQADIFNVNMKVLKLEQTREAGSVIINETKNIVITVLAAMSVINGNLTLGMMLAVQYIIGQLNLPIEQLITFLHSLQDVKISLERINDIHEADDENVDFGIRTCFPKSDKSLNIQDVSFKYDKSNTQYVLDDVNIIIPEGKVTAIVGTSGSGKTTLIKLMLGYYNADSGKITIGGILQKDYNIKWWRRQCGVVMQDGYIFSDTIARNIAVDDGEIDKVKLLQAVRIANIEEDIENMPLKYNTLIGQDGVGLSQGQKQRILIARAVYKNPQYIFLDEATNSLDANNERMIVDNLRDFYKGKTVLIVAHRLSTVKNADRIIVIEKGKIVEIGNHTELLAMQGAYFKLIKNQLELGN